MNKIVVKGFTLLKTAEGRRISYVYSTIDENGDVVKENVNESFVVVDDSLGSNIDSILEFIMNRLNKQ